MLLLYFACMTAVGAPPEYRYRMPLEPIMIVSVVSSAILLARWLFPNSRLFVIESQAYDK